MYPQLSAAPSRTARAARIAGLGVATAILATLVVATPAMAVAKPVGSHVQILFGSSDPAAAMTRADSWSGLHYTVASTTTVADFGCDSGDQLGLAMTEASSDGSNEQPVVPDASTAARDVFSATISADRTFSPETLIEDATTPGSVLSMPISATTKLYTKAQFEQFFIAGGEDTGVRLRALWPAATKHSLVMFCTPGYDETRKQLLVSRDASNRAITSWVQFTTVASAEAPQFTSMGFEIVDQKVTPTVALTGTSTGTTATLTAKLTGKDGALKDAAGTVDFYNGEDATGTKAGSAAVDATGVASVTLDGLTVGSHVYTAVYTPNETAAATYAGATSSPFALTVADKAAATIALKTSTAKYGTAATVTATVSTAGSAATGTVTIAADGTTVFEGPLSGGAATVKLSKTLSVGTHTITATYSGDTTTAAATGTTSVKVAKATSKITVKLSKTKAVVKKTTVKATVTVTVSGVYASGKVTIKVSGKTVKTVSLSSSKKGKITITLPKFTKTGTKKVTATFSTTSTITGKTSSAKSVKVVKK